MKYSEASNIYILYISHLYISWLFFDILNPSSNTNTFCLLHYIWTIRSDAWVCLTFLLICSHSTRLLAATTLRNVLGTKNLAEILSERESISHNMQNSLDEATDPWGVKVERVEMLVFVSYSYLEKSAFDFWYLR